MSAPKEVIDLVERFERNIESYRSGQYNETQLRREFLDPFFEALGWDVHNRQGYAEAYKDVIHEDAIKVGGATKAPDYCFRIGGARKFFVEAKKPSVKLKEEINPAYQLRRYAWSAKLPLSILSDFEEFVAYDCRIKPSKSDSPATARILYVTYDEYVEKWDQITSIFSRDAVLKGSFDKYAESTRLKRGTAEVDDAFLKEIERWREMLAKNIALRNSKLSQRELNFAVQRTIDRIIFIRICEDRGIEVYGKLQSLLNGENTYARLRKFFYDADDCYNSGLFHFKEEKGRAEPPDELTLSLKIDDKVLKDIVRELYYPESPYEFSVLSADILGNVYEQFLGKVIRLTAGHRAVVEDKPEVKKAGGVYYTPKYIVDYIVKNTVGRLLYPNQHSHPELHPESRLWRERIVPGSDKGLSPREILKLRILDPACGSGSFLLGAYTYLLDYHRDWYLKDGVEKHTKEIYQGAGGQWYLTTQEKKRILLNTIYGVDIDSQAVEVTKLNLMLRVLEGENEETLNRQLRLWHERALPDLGSNIKCGNSLIGPDFYENKQLSLLDEEERIRINVFDWEKEFREIMKAGGFDVVIGNPPYSAKQSLETKKLVEYFTSVEYKCDPFAFFLEQGLNKLKKSGLLGFIIPVTWMTNYYYMKLRKLLVDSNSLRKVVLIDGLVFENANVDTCLIFLEKESVESRQFEWVRSATNQLSDVGINRRYDDIVSEERYDIVPEFDKEWQVARRKLESVSTRLDELVTISLGMKLRSNKEFVTAKRDKAHPDPIYFGDNISRYGSLKPSRFFDFSKAVIVGGTKKPNVHKAKRKILVQAIRNLSLKRKIVATLDTDGYCFIGTVNGIVPKDCPYNMQYLLGLLNSRLINTYFAKRFTTISLTAAFLGPIPIRKLNLQIDADKSPHNRVVELVDQMLSLHKQLAAAKTPDEKTNLQRQIGATDRQIDSLVYELYGLTEEEIKIVEGQGS